MKFVLDQTLCRDNGEILLETAVYERLESFSPWIGKLDPVLDNQP